VPPDWAPLLRVDGGRNEDKQVRIIGLVLGFALLDLLARTAAAEPAIREETVLFANGSSAATINGHMTGDTTFGLACVFESHLIPPPLFLRARARG